MPARSPTKRRRKAAPSKGRKTKRSPPKKRKAAKSPPKKRKAAKRKAAKRKSSAKKPKLKRRKLIAPRKKPPKPAKKEIPDIREVMAERREEQREEPTFPDRGEQWKTIDPFEERVDWDTGEVLDEDEDAPIIDPGGDPDELPGFEPFKDLPPGVDVHDYIAWLHEAYDLDMGELYEMYFGDSDS